MEQALVKYPCGAESWMIKLETLDDFMEYAGITEKNCSAFIHKVMTSGVPVDRWDHIWEKSEEGVMFNAMINKCQSVGGTPLIEYCKLFDQKMRSILTQVVSNNVVVITSVGGWMTLTEDYDILDIRAYRRPDPTTHSVRFGTKYINLENDPKLEEFTVSTLGALDPHYSYVLNLRSYSPEGLNKIFERFVAYGGDTVWQYTTGMDVQQMEEYCDIALECGITNFVFYFSCEVNESISGFIDELSQKANVEVL